MKMSILKAMRSKRGFGPILRDWEVIEGEIIAGEIIEVKFIKGKGFHLFGKNIAI